MHPTLNLRQQGDMSQRYWHNQPPRNRFFIMTAVLLAGTGLAYYWGYRGVDRRHSGDSECCHYLLETVFSASFPSFRNTCQEVTRMSWERGMFYWSSLAR
ncbi:hypothetical protein P692DRAFT_20718019 [Suillus brevipes Sb2]|nr:hypothetical protein P692DRAFT_20718019 [Suillus brevipes Sb2]